MKATKQAASSATEALDPEDRAALDLTQQADGAGNQGPAPSPPGVDSPQGASTPTPQAQTYAGYAASLCNEFFVRRFGPDKGLSPQLLDAIRADLALALDTYFPRIEAKPGLFALVALGGHFLACQTEAKASARQSGSSGKAEPEKLRSSSLSSVEASAS